LRFDTPVLYEPQMYNDQVDYRHLSPVQREAAAELLNGRMATHTFFAVRAGAAVPAPPAWDDEEAIPTWLGLDQRRLAGVLADAPILEIDYDGLTYRQPLEPVPRAFLRAIDGRRALGSVLDEVAAHFPAVPRPSLREAWQRLFQRAAAFNLLGMFPARGERDAPYLS
jgi:hypothetical protein